MTYLKIASACLISLLLLSGCRHSNDLSKSIKDFKETNPGKGGMSLFLYPSTIRMLNFDKDTSFNSLVKDIQKLKIIKTDSVKPEQVQKLIDTIRKESFVDLLQMKQNNQQYLVFLRKENNKPKEFVGIIYSESSLLVIDLLGTIPVTSLPSLINGNMKMTGFASLFNSAKSQKPSKQKHEKRPSDK